jgi:hypothetical protein
MAHASESENPVVAVVVAGHSVDTNEPVAERQLLRMSPLSAAVAGDSSRRTSVGNNSRSPVPRYLPLSASSPSPRTFGGINGSPKLSQHASSGGIVRVSSPVMQLGISCSGKKEGTQPNIQTPGTPRKISASPIEKAHSRIIALSPRSSPATTDSRHMTLQPKGSVSGADVIESDYRIQAESSPLARDWSVFDNASVLRSSAVNAAALAQHALGGRAEQDSFFTGTAAVNAKCPSHDRIPSPISQEGQNASDSHLSITHPKLDEHSSMKELYNRASSATPRSAKTNQPTRNRPGSARVNEPAALSTYAAGADISSPAVADLVAKFESAAISKSRSRTGATSLPGRNQTTASSSLASKNAACQKLSPRSDAVESALLQMELRSASESAVKEGISTSVIQLHPQNAVWNQDPPTLLREFYADSTVHGVTVIACSTPKSHPSAQPTFRTPLKPSAACHVQNPVLCCPPV